MVGALAAVLVATTGALLLTERGGSQGKPAGGPAHTSATSGTPNPNTGTVYVSNYGDGTVSVIRPNGTLGKPITVGEYPFDTAIAPAGTPSAGTVYIL